MKNLSLILNAILAIAVIVLFVKVYSGDSASGSTKKVASKKPKQKMKRFPCQICGKNFAIMQQHLHHAHGITDDEPHTK